MFPRHWFKRLWLIGLITLSTWSCKTTRLPQLPTSGTLIAHPPPGVESILVEDGESSQPAFSPDGERIVFVSAKRKGHLLEQIYEKNLATGEERRVTFQSGQALQPSYHPKLNKITYISSTDELREQPPRYIPDPTPSKLPGDFQSLVEVYTHDLSALDINRITKHPGFDGEPRFHRDGALTYTRALSDRLEVVSYSPHSGSSHVLRKLGKNTSCFTTSADGKLGAWLEWDNEFQTSTLKFQRGGSRPEITNVDTAAVKRDLRFSPDGKWLLWSHGDSKGQFAIWIMDVASLCPRPLVMDEKARVRHPALSANMKTLVYTRVSDGRSRIAWRVFEPPAGTCATTH